MTVYFCIPLKSKQTTNNWPLIESLFNRTLKSIYNQSVDDFRIIVACHEIPAISTPIDSRLEFLQADYKPPKMAGDITMDKSQEHIRLSDKGAKKDMLANKLYEYGGGYVMFVDADDLISRRLVEYVLRDGHKYGYIIKKGYEYNYQSSMIKYEFWFHRICGSSLILNLSKEDLATHKGIKNSTSAYTKLMSRGHYYVNENSRKLRRPLKTLPFFGAMYVINTGENESQMFDNIGWKRKIMRLVIPEFAPSRKIGVEFGLD